MTKIYIPSEARVNLLQVLKGGMTSSTTHSSVNFHLFKSNITPSLSDTLSTYSAQESDYSGYVAQAAGAWSTPATSGGVSFMAASELLFQHNGGGTSNTVYGYYVTDNTDAKLLWVQKFAAARSMADTTGIIRVTPRLVAEHMTSGLYLHDLARVNVLKMLKNGMSNSTTYGGANVHLCKSNITPAASDVLATYSAQESDYSGYAAQAAAWGIPITATGVSSLPGVGQMHQHNGGGTSNTIYLYYVTDNTNADLLWVEVFASSKSMAAVADIIQFVPRMGLEAIP